MFWHNNETTHKKNRSGIIDSKQDGAGNILYYQEKVNKGGSGENLST